MISDIGLAFLGSALFWITVAGMAFRGLKLDFALVEERLKLLFQRVDRFEFNATAIFKSAAQATLASIYGQGVLRLVLVTLIATASVNVVTFTLLYSDWKKLQIDTLPDEREVMMAVDKGYYDYLTSAAGIKELKRAAEVIVIPQVGSAPKYTDERDNRVRAAYIDFTAKVNLYAMSHGLSYRIGLEKLFANSASNRVWTPDESEGVGIPFIFSVAWSLTFDSIAAYLCIAAIRNPPNIARVLFLLGGILTCFFLSLVTYAGLFQGKPLGSLYLLDALKIFVLPLILLQFLAEVIWSALPNTDSRPRPGRIVVAGALYLIAASVCIVLASMTPGGRQSIANLAPWIFLLTHGIAPKAAVLAAPTIFPLLAVAALGVCIGISKLGISSGKAVLLGQIYGLSVMSGGTYFLAFMTVVIAICTTVTSLVMLWLSHGPH